MEKQLMFVDLPSELIFQIVSGFEFEIRHVLKLRALNRAHYEAYDIENILKLYKQYPQAELVQGKQTAFLRGKDNTLLEFVKQLAKTTTWTQIQSRLVDYGAYKGYYSLKIIATLTAVRSKNKPFLMDSLTDKQLENDLRRNYKNSKTVFRYALEPNDEQYAKFMLAHPILTPSLQEVRTSTRYLGGIIEDYLGVIKDKPINAEIISQLVALFEPEDLANFYSWIHVITHARFDMNIINGVMAYISPIIQIIYKAQIKNCPDCLYSALCSNSFASLLSFWDYGELPTSHAYHINGAISPNGLEWLTENIRVNAQGRQEGLEFLTGDAETQSFVLMESILRSLEKKKGFIFINNEHLEIFKKLADLGLKLSLCPNSWHKILVEYKLCTRDACKIIEVVWLKFPDVVRELLPKMLVWSMDVPYLELVIHETIQRSPNSILNDLKGNNSGYTLLHAFASRLKWVNNTPEQVLKVIDLLTKSYGIDINALDKEGRAFFDYFNDIWYHNVPMENILLFEGLLDRGLQFRLAAGRQISPYWFNPKFQLNAQTRCISMDIKLRPKKYRCIATLSYEFFEGEIADLALEANILWHALKIPDVEPRFIHMEIMPGEYYYRWIINLQPVVDPNLPVVYSKDGKQYNILIVPEASEDNMIY